MSRVKYCESWEEVKKQSVQQYLLNILCASGLGIENKVLIKTGKMCAFRQGFSEEVTFELRPAC